MRLVGTIGLGLVALCVGVACGDTSERPEAEPSATATATFDGVVDAKEALAASAILTSDAEVGQFLRQYRATIGTWSAAEVEGSASGAYAEIRFPEAPIALPGAPMIRAANRSRAEGVPATNAQGEPVAGVRDLIMERVTIPADEAMVDYYEVFVDLDTKTIVWLGPATPPPAPIPSQPDPPYVSPRSDSEPPMLGTGEPPRLARPSTHDAVGDGTTTAPVPGARHERRTPGRRSWCEPVSRHRTASASRQFGAGR